jgi:hypothetical protein
MTNVDTAARAEHRARDARIALESYKQTCLQYCDGRATYAELGEARGKQQGTLVNLLTTVEALFGLKRDEEIDAA